ncbi:oxygen-dependent coproporphyrinogen oxidase [Aurantibacillus circumpalustris]|uniref:oxygen-dependent coproporphyrinogen oxidase n=1 Tax=Aurantibacillus circumpalustris TaxID=3036359 RepID=UPI00295AD41D|nr:oxygen-dependent coproporphyrinogen oxidase [Aurantibacillus circumpalustris]
MEINRIEISNWLKNLQDSICFSLEKADGKSLFEEENWTREEGGGGRTRIIKDGNVIEKGGVLFSAVEGIAPDFLFKEKEHSISEPTNENTKPVFFATGVSIVIHPKNPMVPIIHMNIRYFEMSGGIRWLGGGIDLTPHYIVQEDANYFHTQLKNVCDKHHKDYYNKFKKWADDYFYISHRKETRGVGGIFFDRLNEEDSMSFEKNFNFWKEVGEAFTPTYTTLIEKNKNKTYTDKNKEWQLLRRGRYVEFNLVYDKGTKFGLETNGRVESILMSLPKLAGWEYDFTPDKNSEEEKTLGLLKKDIDWIANH